MIMGVGRPGYSVRRQTTTATKTALSFSLNNIHTTLQVLSSFSASECLEKMLAIFRGLRPLSFPMVTTLCRACLQFSKSFIQAHTGSATFCRSSCHEIQPGPPAPNSRASDVPSLSLGFCTTCIFNVMACAKSDKLL